MAKPMMPMTTIIGEVELVVGEADIAHHQVAHDGLAVIASFQPHHERRARRRFGSIAVSPASVIADRLAGGALGFAHLGQFLGRGVAAIGLAFRQQLLGHGAVTAGARELVDGLAIPVQAHPFHPVQDRGHRFRRGALPVGVLDAQQERAARVAGIQPVEQGGAGAADMQHACGRGREAQDRLFVLRHGGDRVANGFR